LIFDVLSTKEQLVDESLGEAFLGSPQTPRPIFLVNKVFFFFFL
jgi:hypothetical protein